LDFHRIDQRDDALINVIASTAFECSDVKARPAGRRGEPSIVFDPVVEFSALVTHRGSTFRVPMRGDKRPAVHAKASPEEGDQQNPLDVVKQMFREIDDANRGRPTWMKQDLKLVSSN
jgi:hypothetical protein